MDQLPATPFSIKRYLHLAVRLFIASSGGYDPLARKWDTSDSQSSEEVAEIRNYEAAKLSVRQPEWNSLGFRSSGDYLQKLFEDDNSPIEGREVDNPDPTVPVGLKNPQSKRWSTGSYAPASLAMHASPSLVPSSFQFRHSLFPFDQQSALDLSQNPPQSRDNVNPAYSNPNDPPDLHASLPKERVSPPLEDMNPSDSDLVPREQEGCLSDEPRWVRGKGDNCEGWCGFCRPGRWLLLKNGTFWYHKLFEHELSATLNLSGQEP